MSYSGALTKKLRQVANDISKLLLEYKSMTKDGVAIVSNPESIIDLWKREKERRNPNFMELHNPFLNALINLGEIDADEAYRESLKIRKNIAEALGVSKMYECSFLIEWARKLSGKITYLLRMMLGYSEEVKIKYPELLQDLREARRWLDKLAEKLAMQYGVLEEDEYYELVGKTLYYAYIAMESARQLADYHDEFMARTAVLPTRYGEGIEWFEKEEKIEEERVKGERKI